MWKSGAFAPRYELHVTEALALVVVLLSQTAASRSVPPLLIYDIK